MIHAGILWLFLAYVSFHSHILGSYFALHEVVVPRTMTVSEVQFARDTFILTRL